MIYTQVWEISHENAKKALQSLAHTVIGMILLGVANSDVQARAITN